MLARRLSVHATPRRRSSPAWRQAIAKELARLEDSSAYSLRVRPANLKASKGYIEASRRAFMTNCLHCFHARCIKRFVDETFHEGHDGGMPRLRRRSFLRDFAETLVMCAQMPSLGPAEQGRHFRWTIATCPRIYPRRSFESGRALNGELGPSARWTQTPSGRP